MRSLLFDWRLSRFELLSTLVMAVLITVAGGILVVRLEELAPPLDCLLGHFAYTQEVAGPQTACGSAAAFLEFSSTYVPPFMVAMSALPLIGGALIGSQLVAREVDHGTAQLTWAMAASRRRWLLGRVLRLGLAVTLLMVVPAMAAIFVEAAKAPWWDPSQSFSDYGLRGPLVVARALAVFGLGILLGTVVGRILPALALTLVGALLLFVGSAMGRPFGASVVELPAPTAAAVDLTSDLVVARVVRAPDGRLVSREEAMAQSPHPPGSTEAFFWVIDTLDEVEIGVPGSRLGEVEVREALMLLLLGAAATATATVTIRRRRPY